MSRLRDNGLSLAFGALFLVALGGQALVGHAAYDHEQIAAGAAPVSLGRYVSSSVFWVDVMENWQSEYLQFTLYILATVWLVQRGSTESKAPDEAGPGSDRSGPAGRGLRPFAASHSLVLVMAAVWLGTWFASAVTGRVAYNAEQFEAREGAVSLAGYVASSDFWNRTLQNWQSEFLAVGSMVILSVFLRERGSSESKPVGSPDEETGTEAG